MTKLDLSNTVIKVLNREHGKKVVAFFKANGINTSSYRGTCTVEDGNTCCYYGCNKGYFSNRNISIVRSYHLTIIELPESKSFPEKWVVRGEYKCDDPNRPSTNPNHWFNTVCGCKRHVGFLTAYYYSKYTYYSYIPEGYIEVTKEQLLNHYNINLNKNNNEVLKKITKQRPTRIEGIRANCQKVKIASGCRPIGSRNTNSRKRIRVRRTQIKGKQLFSY